MVMCSHQTCASTACARAALWIRGMSAHSNHMHAAAWRIGTAHSVTDDAPPTSLGLSTRTP